MRKQFDEQLAKLRIQLKEVGSYCEESFDATLRIFFDGDLSLAERVFSLTSVLDKKNRKVEKLCFMLLLRQQPVAIDLRTITASLKVNYDLKRIASQSFDITEIVKLSQITDHKQTDEEQLKILKTMSRQTQKLLSGCLKAFFEQDVEEAKALIEADDLVDECFAKMKICIGKSLNTKTNGHDSVDLLMIAKYFERLADHCVNISRWTVKYFN